MNRQLAIFVPVFIIIIIFSFPTTSVSAPKKPLKVALILWRGETPAESGFKEGLDVLGYAAEYKTFNANQNRSDLGEALRRQIVFEQFDYIYTFGTTASRMAKTLLSERVPQVFNIVAAPVSSGLVESMASTGGDISGASNRVPLRTQIENALKVIRFKRLGIIFNPREKNSGIARERLIELGKKMDFEVVSFRSAPVNQMLEKNLRKITEKSVTVDAVYLPADSYVVSEADLIGRELRKAGIPSIGAIQKYVEKGATMGTVADYANLGKLCAKIVDRHQKGEKLRSIPVWIDENPIVMLNKTTIDLLKINIDREILKAARIVE